MFWICFGSVCHWQVLVARTNVATVCYWDLVQKTQMARASAFGSTSIVDCLDCFLPVMIGSKGAAYNDTASIPTLCSSKWPLYRRLTNFECCKAAASMWRFLFAVSVTAEPEMSTRRGGLGLEGLFRIDPRAMMSGSFRSVPKIRKTQHVVGSRWSKTTIVETQFFGQQVVGSDLAAASQQFYLDYSQQVYT